MFHPRKLHFFRTLAVVVVVLACLSALPRETKHHDPSQAAPAQSASASYLPAASKDHARLLAQASYPNLPLSFEPNLGQTDSQVMFTSRAGNRTLWLTKDEAILAVGRASRPERINQRRMAVAKAELFRKEQAAPMVLRMKFIGANAAPGIVGEERQPGTVNYFIGKPNEWRTKIPTFARVRYRSLYAGIDLIFYGNNHELEYDLVVSRR